METGTSSTGTSSISSRPAAGGAGGRPKDRAARNAGIFLLLTAAVTVVMVLARVSSDTDQPTLAESLRAIADNTAIYSVAGTARFLSGLTLIIASWYLLRTWIIRERMVTPLAPWLFAASGLFTAVSGVCALLLAACPALVALEVTYVNGIPDVKIPAIVEAVYNIRWVAGKAGFSAAGVSLVIATRYQWKVGGILRMVAPASAVLGIAMQFIWVDAAPLLHPVIGLGFLLWLLVIGPMLATGHVERLFTKIAGASSPD